MANSSNISMANIWNYNNKLGLCLYQAQNTILAICESRVMNLNL